MENIKKLIQNVTDIQNEYDHEDDVDEKSIYSDDDATAPVKKQRKPRNKSTSIKTKAQKSKIKNITTGSSIIKINPDDNNDTHDNNTNN